jgi:hypothetical protein
MIVLRHVLKLHGDVVEAEGQFGRMVIANITFIARKWVGFQQHEKKTCDKDNTLYWLSSTGPLRATRLMVRTLNKRLVAKEASINVCDLSENQYLRY